MPTVMQQRGQAGVLGDGHDLLQVLCLKLPSLVKIQAKRQKQQIPASLDMPPTFDGTFKTPRTRRNLFHTIIESSQFRAVGI